MNFVLTVSLRYVSNFVAEKEGTQPKPRRLLVYISFKLSTLANCRIVLSAAGPTCLHRGWTVVPVRNYAKSYLSENRCTVLYQRSNTVNDSAFLTDAVNTLVGLITPLLNAYIYAKHLSRCNYIYTFITSDQESPPDVNRSLSKPETRISLLKRLLFTF